MSETTTNGFKRIMNDRFSKKLFLIVGVLIFVVIIYTLFFNGNHTTKNVTTLNPAPQINGVQGTNVNSPAYNQALAADNKTREQEAKKTGSDFLPTIQKPSSSDLPSSLNLPPETPATVYRPDANIPPTPVVVPVTTNANGFPPAIQNTNGNQQTVNALDPNLVSIYQNEMRTIMDDKLTPASTIEYKLSNNKVNYSSDSSNNSSGSTISSSSNLKTQDTSNLNIQQNNKTKFPVPVAGTIVYSQLVGSINSDDPGPVIADILEGPYAGARLLGSFQAESDGVIIEFTTMTVPYKDAQGNDQAQVVPIKAVAVDTSQLGTSLATSVNDHMLARVAVAFATSFIQGFGQAISQSGATSVVNSTTGSAITSNPIQSTPNELYQAGGTAAGQIGQIINQHYANLKTTIKVASGTPFGLLFMNTSN